MKYPFRFLLALLLLLPLSAAQGQTRIVTGKVVDSMTSDVVTTGQVGLQGSTIGTTIKDDGTFTLAVPPKDVVLGTFWKRGSHIGESVGTGNM